MEENESTNCLAYIGAKNGYQRPEDMMPLCCPSGKEQT